MLRSELAVLVIGSMEGCREDDRLEHGEVVDQGVAVVWDNNGKTSAEMTMVLN